MKGMAGGLQSKGPTLQSITQFQQFNASTQNLQEIRATSPQNRPLGVSMGDLKAMMTKKTTTMNVNEGSSLPQLGKDEYNRSSSAMKPKSAAVSKRRIKQQLEQLSPRDQPPYLATTFQQQQRITNINVSDNAQNTDFEVRLKELHHAKDSTMRLNAKVIETWINETLLDAEHLDIPGVVLKPEHKNPVSRYQIDRLSLTNQGVPNDQVDRIYRGLFVYSIGFYEMLQKCLHHASNKYILLSSIWRVFAILLEYCCKSNYQMLISKLNMEHKDIIDQIEKDFNDHIQKMTESEKHLKEALDDLQKRKDVLEKQKEEEEFLRKKIEDEFSKKVETHEEEVQLRLKFEQKLNNMHALHRDLQAKYQRALEDIYQFETTNTTLQQQVTEQKSELVILRSEKVENESRIMYQGERIKQLIIECDLKMRQANDLEFKLSRANMEIENKSLDNKDMEKKVNQQRLKIEANQALIEGLQSEKNHLELSLKENQDQKVQYKEKSDRLQKLNEEIFTEMQEYKMQLVGVHEIKRDRDDRLEKLRAELEDLSKRHEIMDKEYTSLMVGHDHISDEHKTLKADYESVCEKLRLSNKVRNDKEELLNEKTKNLHALGEQYQDKELSLEKMKREVEKLNRRLNEVEMQNDQLEIKKRSVEKQSEIQRKQLLEKISSLNEVIGQEKDTRETWIGRYEKEQKSHITTNNELLQNKGVLQDALLKVKSLEIVVDSLTKQRDLTKLNNHDLQRQVTDLMIAKENAERELYSKSELLRTVEDHHLVYLRKIQDDHKKVLKVKEWQIHGKDMEYEDIRSYSRDLHKENEANKTEAAFVKVQIIAEKHTRTMIEEQLNKLLANYVELTRKNNDTTDQLKESVEKNILFEITAQTQTRSLEDLGSQITVLKQKEVELNKLLIQNQALQEKTKALEAHLEGGPSGVLVRGDKQYMNRGIQVKPPKQKDRDIQTDQMVSQLSVPQLGQQPMAYSTTQASTNIHSSQSQKRPRIASAAANTNATLAFSGASQIMRDPSHGVTSSQGDFTLSEQAMPVTINRGSMSNFSQEFERSGIKSQAQKYRHIIPGGTEAIEEEVENYGTGQHYSQQDLQYQSLQQQQSVQRKTTSSISGQGAQTFGGQPQPTGLKNHQQASRQIGSIYNQNDYITNSDNEFEMNKKNSNLSNFKNDAGNDPMSNDALRAVYEKRITQGAIVQTRPLSQPNQFRHSQTMQAQNTQHNQPVRILSAAETQMRVEMQQLQKQMTLMNSSSSQNAFGKLTERPVTGKTSIRNLIKVATARD